MRSYSKTILSAAIFGVISLIWSLSAHAQRQPVIIAPPLVGDSVKAGKTLTVVDTVFTDGVLSARIAQTKGIDNIVALYINEYAGKMLPDTFHVSVIVEVNYETTTGSTGTRNDTLKINYSKNFPYASKAVKFYKNYVSLQVEILDVTITAATASLVRPSIELENMMVIDRVFTADCAAISSVSVDDDYVVSEGELVVSWPAPDAFVSSYDLEWTYIDSAALADGNYNTGGDIDPELVFKNNSTRVSITANSYRIPMLYDGTGTLFFRVRTVQAAVDGELIAGQWSTESGGSGFGSFDFKGHERPLNWQATTSFAEEGKRKSVVQYFDGSLKSRQTVTKDNTVNRTVVAETLYDKQGRPVIQVLPSPTISKLIAYSPLFNVDINSAEFDKSIYDTLNNANDYCDCKTDSMGTASGASRYYSDQNDLLATPDEHQYVPKANGYAFAETRYTRDNTGRIDRQGGVGKPFQIGSGKETRYYYGSVDQKELNALFGTEAGDASHYEKNMVRDANGQYSVSYVDMKGRTVATALAGNAPDNLFQLSSFDSLRQTDQLLSLSNNIVRENKIVANKSILVPKDGRYDFHYSLSAESLSLDDCKETTVCYDCLYDLTITITGNCDTGIVVASPTIITLKNFSLFKTDSVTYNLDTTCTVATPLDTTFSVWLEAGSYDISKDLTMSKEGMAYYRDSIYLKHNTCKQFDDFLVEALDSIRTRLDCTPDSIRTNLVTAYRDQMLADLYPGAGQYGELNGTHCFSIFSQAPGSAGLLYYQTRANYKNADGTDAIVMRPNATTGALEEVSPKDLTPTEFMNSFQESWAEALLPLHPEYQLLAEFEKLKSAYNWEADFFETDTYAQAVAKGYLNPTGNTNQPATRFTVSGKTDSLFAALTISDPSIVNTAKADLNEKLFNYVIKDPSTHPGEYYNLWAMSTAMAACKDLSATCLDHWAQNSIVFNTDSLCTGDLDMAWRYFKMQYLEFRENWIDDYLRDKTGIYAANISPCYPVFPDRNIANATIPAGYTSYTGTVSDTTAAANNLDVLILQNCQAQALRWWQELAPCGYTAADSTEIISRLITVCQEGGDAKHSFGSSTVKPSSTNDDRSFEQVINEYNTAHYPGIDPVRCNAYLITNPKPYETSVMIVNQPVIAAPDSCTCAKINSVYNAYVADSSSYDNFSDYMFKVKGTRITQGVLDTLRGLCTSTANCQFLSKPILLPPALQCNMPSACISCIEMQDAYTLFKSKFPGAFPGYAETDSTQQLVNTVFKNFMNQRFGFGKTAQEYLDFLNQCGSTVGLSPGCDSLQLWLNDYKVIRQEVASGMAVGGYRMTSVMSTIAEGFNGLLEVQAGKHLTNTLSPRYGYVTHNLFSATNKLFSVSDYSTVVGPYYTGVIPFDVNNIASTDPSLLSRVQRYAKSVTVSSDDFQGTYTTLDLSKKYVALAMAGYSVQDSFSLFFGSRRAWTTLDSVCAPNLTNWYKTPGPLAKYLEDSLCGELNCDYYTFSFVKPLSNVTSYTDYKNRAVAGSIYLMSEIKKIVSYTLDAHLIHLYRASTPPLNPITQVPAFIKARVLLSDNTEVDAWVMSSNCTNMNLIYTQEVDSTIYGPDCQAGFAKYFNSKNSTSYSFHQIDSIYQLTCGIPLNVCDTIINTCDSTHWNVYNPGTSLEINKDLYANATNNINPVSQFFQGGKFTSPTNVQASHYVLVNKRDSMLAGTKNVMMQWRVKPDSLNAMINPFIRRGDTTIYVGAQWVIDPSDSAWWIGATVLSGSDGSRINGIGLLSNAHSLQADWVKLTNVTGDSLYYIDNFNVSDSGCYTVYAGPYLCGLQAADSMIALNMEPCADTLNQALQIATHLYTLYQQRLKGEFEEAYSNKCMDAAKIESFTVNHPVTEYHYTLYYYDQAGNLVKTVPPEGVQVIRRDSFSDSVNTKRAAGDTLRPRHTLATTYRYNSLNQVISQHTPDAGLSEFWYDRLGRLVISRNAQQTIDGNYSYTRYDALGRITEVGQKKQSSDATQTITRANSQLLSWLNKRYYSGTDSLMAEQVTATVYDQRDPAAATLPASDYVVGPAFQQAFKLRNRVSYTRYYDRLVWNGSTTLVSDYDNSTTYSYDIHGNVDTLLHHYRTGYMANGHGDNEFKSMAYRYDLISGKVNEVHYQPGMPDQFYHRYEYDAENKLTDAYTTDRKALLGIPVLEEHDARYAYYRHGPLSKTILGQQEVQGVDYAYTLQGWIKGVNNDSLLDDDGKSGSFVARDAYRYYLNYFNGEYQPIGAAVTNVFPGHTAHMGADAADYKPLYNGNISSMVVGVPKLGETNLYNYGYDQLNRIVSMDVWKGFDATTSNWTGATKTQDYRERISYDANGNILAYNRHGFGGAIPMDSLRYGYNKDGDGRLANNRLRHVKDDVSTTPGYDDIESQADDNYGYDAIGNLVRDDKENINVIEWTLYGKISKIIRNRGTSDSIVINYEYNAAGYRVGKIVTKNGVSTGTFFVRNEQGKVMAIYSSISDKLVLNELTIYGIGRIGTYLVSIDMNQSQNVESYNYQRGLKRYELRNQVESVLATISDEKHGVDVDSDNIIDSYESVVISASDYFPGGMVMEGREFNQGSYRFGFGGHEKSDEIKGIGNSYTAEFWEYDPRLLRRWNCDPVLNVSQSPYVALENNPILITDISGANPDEPVPTKQEKQIVAAYEIVKKRFVAKQNNKDISMDLAADALEWYSKEYDPVKNPEYAKLPMSDYQKFEDIVMDVWYRSFATAAFNRYESNDKIIQSMSTTSGKALAILALSEKDQKGAKFFFQILLPTTTEIVTGMFATLGALNSSSFLNNGTKRNLLKSSPLFSDIPEGAWGALGQRGEDITELMLRRAYPNATIAKQVFYRIDKNTASYCDFVVINEGKVVSVWESKVNQAVMSDAQKAMIIEGKSGIFTGKVANQFGLTGQSLPAEALRSEVRFGSKTGNITVNSYGQ